MFFNSLTFVGFFLIVLSLLSVERLATKSVKLRNATLLLASYFFYAYFNIGFTLILLFITLLNYFVGKRLVVSKSKKVLAICLILSLLPLIFFKYSLFLCKAFVGLLEIEIGIELLNGLLLPVGISFFTFQALSYSIDIYRGKIEKAASPLDFSLFVAFFPTILSGPIEKARNLLPQIAKYSFPTSQDIAQGACIYIWGLFKKMVVADRLANYVDWAYDSAQYSSGGTLFVAAVFYSIQIYCDFSGYSDMALGVAKSLGFNVTKNFRQPYFSTTFKDFWRKWHIALTSWFTEYVYFSLGGNRVKHKLRWVFNISTIFLLSGLWHGAAWSFLIWGALHAFYYLTEHFLGLQKPEIRRGKIMNLITGVAVFLFVTLAWVFFRLDFSSSVYVILKILNEGISEFSMGASSFTFISTVAIMLVFIFYELMVKWGWITYDVERFENKIKLNLVSVIPMLVLICMYGVSSDNFVYFQF